MKRDFTDEGAILAQLKLGMENNAMLRLILSNQALIMTRLMINPKQRCPPFIEEVDLMDKPGKADLMLRGWLEGVKQIENDVIKRTWDYAVEHDSNFNPPDDIGLNP